MVLGKLDIHLQNNKIEQLSYNHTQHTKINCRTPRGKQIGENLLDIGLGDDFLDMAPKAQPTKA